MESQQRSHLHLPWLLVRRSLLRSRQTELEVPVFRYSSLPWRRPDGIFLHQRNDAYARLHLRFPEDVGQLHRAQQSRRSRHRSRWERDKRNGTSRPRQQPALADVLEWLPHSDEPEHDGRNGQDCTSDPRLLV